MSRFDGKLDPAGEAVVAPSELLAALTSDDAREQRNSAIALCLSGGEGWEEALRMLGGTFAPGVAATSPAASKGSSDR